MNYQLLESGKAIVRGGKEKVADTYRPPASQTTSKYYQNRLPAQTTGTDYQHSKFSDRCWRISGKRIFWCISWGG